jgi:RecJ-like exonuclease
VDLPELPEPEEAECYACDGTGEVEDEAPEGEEPEDTTCTECGGTGQVTPDEPTEEQLSDWMSEVRDALQSVLDKSPV